MSILTEILTSAQGGNLVENLAHNYGLSTEQVEAAVKALTPALGLALQNATTNPQVLEQIVAGLVHPTHQAAFGDPSVAHGEEAGALGSGTVAHLFGSSSAAGEIAQIAARQSGLRADILSQLLPVLLSVVLGGLFKKFEGQGLGGLLAKLAGAGALGTILSQLGAGSAQAAPGGGGAAGGGGLGGLLGGLLGSLLGGGSRGGAQAPAPGSSGGGLEDVLGQLIKTLNAPTPTPAGVPAGHTAELQDVLDKVFPSH
jgi:hypothetical protein